MDEKKKKKVKRFRIRPISLSKSDARADLTGFEDKIYGWPRFSNKTSWQTSPSSLVSMRPHQVSPPQARAR